MNTLGQLAALVNAKTYDGDAEKQIKAVASLATATAMEIAYFDDPARLKWLEQTRAGVVVLSAQYMMQCPTSSLVVSDPALAIAQIQQSFDLSTRHKAVIHPNVVLSSSCQLGHNVSIGPNTYIGDRVVLGDNTAVGAGCIIESDTFIGANTTIDHGSVIHKNVSIGSDVQIDSGAVIGAMPFNGVKSKGAWLQGPAFGTVIIEDNVHVGSNTVIDRGGFTDTVINSGVTIDNLVQIAHDTIIGPYTAIAGCAAIGANCSIGAHCVIGGASTIAANVHLVDEVVITGMSSVSKSLKKSGIFSSGSMVSEHHQWRKNVARFRKLDKWIKRLKTLETQNQI